MPDKSPAHTHSEHWGEQLTFSQLSFHLEQMHLIPFEDLVKTRSLNVLHNSLHNPSPTIVGRTSDGRHVTGEEAAKEASKEMQRWADSAMYRSEPMPNAGAGPTVTLINATPDPLGGLAALCGIYEGRVVRALGDVSDDERRAALEAMLSTELNGPLESIQFHFLIEGVTRSWTHQAVRERQAFFAQESMRFAVVDEDRWTNRAALPPSLAGTAGGEALGAESSPMEYARNVWDEQMLNAERSYIALIDSGIPAEDARGLMPHAMTTRLHMVLNLRSLLHLAGLRLCTQAQFEWRAVVAGMVLALRGKKSEGEYIPEGWPVSERDAWQFSVMADALKPICYQKGTCGFMAKFDRGCTIRDRVEDFARAGVPSKDWGPESPAHYVPSGHLGLDDRKLIPISNYEWAADPFAARRSK